MYVSLCRKDCVHIHRSLMGFPMWTAKNPVYTIPNSQSHYIICLRPSFASSFAQYVHFSLCDSYPQVLKLLETPISPDPPSHPTAPQKHVPTRRRFCQGSPRRTYLHGEIAWNIYCSPACCANALISVWIAFFQITLIFKGLLGKCSCY